MAFGRRLSLAERGDVLPYAKSIVHASLAADPRRRHRVLQIDYVADATPPSLAWRHVRGAKSRASGYLDMRWHLYA